MTEQVGRGRQLGRWGEYGERLAARYLGDRGMQVLERNWRCEHGEIDLVALDGDCWWCARSRRAAARPSASRWRP